MTIIVTGGAGFIGSNFIIDWLTQTSETVINLDRLSYASNLSNLSSLEGHEHYRFVKGDINDEALVSSLMTDYSPRAIVNFAAESHVDQSIANPHPFISSNILGTFQLLEIARQYVSECGARAKDFRFLQISTDEVYGSLIPGEPTFNEQRAYQPNSPYSASKASADHLVRSYFHTYGLNTLTSNCSNNFGPHQHREKFIPVVINNALSGKNIPVYGDGKNVRDWLYVTDHCQALRMILDKGTPGETYMVGGDCEKSNIDLANEICSKLDRLKPRSDGRSYNTLLSFVTDRLGHDFRYAVDSQKLQSELGWQRSEDFNSGLEKTIRWYLERHDATSVSL